jgi:hypothetical protein
VARADAGATPIALSSEAAWRAVTANRGSRCPRSRPGRPRRHRRRLWWCRSRG